MKKIKIYDTSLRDGAQCSDVHFSVDDKLMIYDRLCDFGIDYIEGGWPGANPKDEEFFEKVYKSKQLASSICKSKLVCFGSTRRIGMKAQDDALLKNLIKSKADCCTIFGKAWDLHVNDALKISLQENLDMIFDSIKFLKKHFEEVFFDAEHFFDGYKANPEYALKALEVASTAGADCLVLCDTNGGTLPFEIGKILDELKQSVKSDLGLHLHNDSDTAVASCLLGAEKGVKQIQGTINGIGERCGNADLVAIVANLELKMGYQILPKGKLKKLKEVSNFVSEIANIGTFKRRPYVGSNSFAHKGGMHVSAVQKNSSTYEHIDPFLVGNIRKILVSDQAGKSNVLEKAEAFGVKLNKKDPKLAKILEQLKILEYQGYAFEDAEASFEILIKKLTGKYKPFFELLSFNVTDSIDPSDKKPKSEATIRIRIENREWRMENGKTKVPSTKYQVQFLEEHTAALGSGPVNALDNALRKALARFYPELNNVKLLDYKVRVLPVKNIEATDSVVRVWIESGDNKEKWSTVGVSQNIIHASWEALKDSLEYYLIKF